MKTEEVVSRCSCEYPDSLVCLLLSAKADIKCRQTVFVWLNGETSSALPSVHSAATGMFSSTSFEVQGALSCLVVLGSGQKALLVLGGEHQLLTF
jgi:hypothetical protein